MYFRPWVHKPFKMQSKLNLLKKGTRHNHGHVCVVRQLKEGPSHSALNRHVLS
jgi:hypothetical protein